jgi:hypothetical protein
MIVVNASNRDKDYQWIARHAGSFGVTLTDQSDDTGLIALQGPAAQEILGRITDADLDSIATTTSLKATSTACLPSSAARDTPVRTASSCTSPPTARPVWRRLLETRLQCRPDPAGLGARDSLRLEMGYALYGNDMDERRTPAGGGARLDHEARQGRVHRPRCAEAPEGGRCAERPRRLRLHGARLPAARLRGPHQRRAGRRGDQRRGQPVDAAGRRHVLRSRGIRQPWHAHRHHGARQGDSGRDRTAPFYREGSVRK